MSIELEHLTKRYGNHLIVDDLNLEIRDGELFVLLGASGSGKSTILRMIAGLTDADQGRVVLHGRDVTHLPSQERNIGMVFQNYSIFRHMTVQQNIEFGLKLRRVSAAERARRCRRILDLVGLAGLGDRFPGQLSGGQQQRVALARALVYEPKVLLLDEPFGALDVKIRTQLRGSLRLIQQELGVTTILVTHDQEEAFELADRIGVLERGRLLEVGRPEELYYRPQSPFVATFLGGGVVVVGRVRGGKACFGHLAFPLPGDAPLEENARVQLLIRPEQVRLRSEPQVGPGEILAGQGQVAEESFAGSLRRIRLRLPHLTGTRQVAPPPPFGERSFLVEAVVPGSEPLPGKQAFVIFRGYHLMKAPPLRQLVIGSQAGDLKTPALVSWMVEVLDGSAMVLSVLPEPAAPAAVRAREEPAAARHRIENRIRHGEFEAAVAAELEESLYDMVVVDCSHQTGRGALPEVVDRLLQEGSLPLLVLKESTARVQRMLIATGAGEPGKKDVRDGGRLARRLSVPADVVHVVPPGQELGDPERSHLDRALSTLRALDLEGELRLRTGQDVAAEVVAEARESGADLLVIGSHLPRGGLLRDTDITRLILEQSDRPVLVIPLGWAAGGAKEGSSV
jgi:ABC-type Fe3+/spermidine/putrescine transport system ATPase subunit/nucleotide-binding universal stress UspA family protein